MSADELRKLAEAAWDGRRGWQPDFGRDNFANRDEVEEFVRACSPDVIFALLDRLDRLTEAAREALSLNPMKAHAILAAALDEGNPS